MAFPETSVLDNFNRSDEGPPMTNWADISSGLVVSSNQCTLSGSGDRISYWNTILTAANFEVYVTIATVPTTNRTIMLYGRIADISAPNFDGYEVEYLNLATDTIRVYRVDNGSETQLGSDITQTLSNGDKLGFSMVGDTITVYVDTGSGWTSLGTRTDSTYTAAGYIGAGIGGNGTLDDFGGGELGITQAIGQVTETDLAQPLAIALGIGQVTETDLAQALAIALGISQVTETDLAQPLAIALGIGQVTETDLAQPFTVVGGQVGGLMAVSAASYYVVVVSAASYYDVVVSAVDYYGAAIEVTEL